MHCTQLGIIMPSKMTFYPRGMAPERNPQTFFVFFHGKLFEIPYSPSSPSLGVSNPQGGGRGGSETLKIGWIFTLIKNGASFCHCTYILLISGLVQDTRFLKEFAYQYNSIFVQLRSMWKKQILARAVRIQKENWW